MLACCLACTKRMIAHCVWFLCWQSLTVRAFLMVPCQTHQRSTHAAATVSDTACPLQQVKMKHCIAHSGSPSSDECYLTALEQTLQAHENSTGTWVSLFIAIASRATCFRCSEATL